jgi:alkylation response protein AidB-like acyl-CoA dehydrogenase
VADPTCRTCRPPRCRIRPIATGVNGAKTWIGNARHCGLIALLCKTDPNATPRHKGISIVLVELGPGLTISRDLPKLGYKGVESCELSFDNFSVPASDVLESRMGEGFSK